LLDVARTEWITSEFDDMSSENLCSGDRGFESVEIEGNEKRRQEAYR